MGKTDKGNALYNTRLTFGQTERVVNFHCNRSANYKNLRIMVAHLVQLG